MNPPMCTQEVHNGYQPFHRAERIDGEEFRWRQILTYIVKMLLCRKSRIQHCCNLAVPQTGEPRKMFCQLESIAVQVIFSDDPKDYVTSVQQLIVCKKCL